MKTFWALYRKELRFLFWPGIGMIAFMNVGWVLLFLEYLWPTYYHNTWDFVFPPHRIYNYGLISLPLTVVFLYSILSEHISGKRHQGFIFPIRRSVPIVAKFSAAVTWAYASFPVTFLLHAIHRLCGYPHSLFEEYAVSHAGSYTGAFLWSAGNILIAGFDMCSLIFLGYAMALTVRRLPILVGTATVIGSTLMIQAIQKFLRYTLYSDIRMILEYGIAANIFLNLVTVLLITTLLLVPALLLYERYAEV